MTTCAICTRHPHEVGADCGEHCRGREIVAGLVCGVCRVRVADDLDAIARAWYAEAPVASGSGRGSERPLPGGTDFLDWKEGADLRDILGANARVWHEDMCAVMDPPAWPGNDPGRLVAWLRRHWDTYGVGHEAVAEFASDVRDLAQRARRLLGDTPAGHVILCPGLEAPCGRRLRVNVADPDELVRCRSCGTEWTTGRLLVHSGDGDGLLDAEAIHLIYGVPGSTLRRWAKTGRVRREGLRYAVADVREAMVARGA